MAMKPEPLRPSTRARSTPCVVSKEKTHSVPFARKIDIQSHSSLFGLKNMVGKKSERDRLQTLGFFGQAPPNMCTCSKKPCRDAQASLKELDSELETTCNRFNAAIKSLGKDGQFQEDKKDAMSDRLHLDGFDMASQKDTIIHYEETGVLFRKIHLDKISNLREHIKEWKVTGFRNDSNWISQTDFDLVNRFFQKWNEYVNYGICVAQLYNIEKRFGSFPDESRCIQLKAVAQVGEKIEEVLPTLRQKFNDPNNFMDNKFFKKTKEKPRKGFHIPEALIEQKRLCANAVRDIRVANILIPEYEAKIPRLPTELFYGGSRLPKVPHEVHQALDDLNYIHDEVQNSCKEVLMLREKVRYIVMIWATTSDVAWEYGTKHIQQLPIMREYDYRRTSLWAEYTVIYRSENKVLEYFQSDKYHKGKNPKFEAALCMDRTPADIEEEWKKRWQMLGSAFKTVPEIVQDVEDLKRSMRKHWAEVEEELTMVLNLSKK